MAVDCDRWNWRELLASEDSHLPPTTRLVLLTLSLHMNEQGANCWPSQVSIAKRAGLSERAVREHLDTAERNHWIRVEQRRRPGRAWKHHQYLPTVPDNLAGKIKGAPWEENRRPAPRSGTQGARPADGARRPADEDATTGTTFRDDRHQVPPNSSSNYPLNQSKERLLTQTNSGSCERGRTQKPGMGDDDKPRRRTGVQSKPNGSIGHAAPARRPGASMTHAEMHALLDSVTDPDSEDFP